MRPAHLHMLAAPLISRGSLRWSVPSTSYHRDTTLLELSGERLGERRIGPLAEREEGADPSGEVPFREGHSRKGGQGSTMIPHTTFTTLLHPIETCGNVLYVAGVLSSPCLAGS